MNAKDRIQQYIDYKGISNSKFEIEVGLSNGYWRKTKSISSSVVEKILRIYSELNPLWVLTGEGEMLRPATISTRDNLNISGGNKGNIRQGDVNNNISISLPEKGTQKIIDPDGTVTIENTSSSVQNNLNEIDMLNQRIQYLERIVSGHEATIKSLETTIKSKDDLICILRGSLDKQD
ncbi:hypothetical protein [Barnesiella intestinihominis]|jgi:hypothetical protein|uniref:hypothetical protein n=1 Tax=Barnesiella intestinihominis TaxID=487174 RepID=UPI0027B933B8|nr:hypothetical protein [Barnesiella intestinihominis]